MARVTGLIGVFYAVEEEVSDDLTFEQARAELERRYAEGELAMDVLEDHEFTDLVWHIDAKEATR